MRVPLRRLVRCVNGGTPSPQAENWDGAVPWATPIDLGRVDGGTLRETDRTLSATGLQVGSRTVPADSLIISTRAPIGYVARVTESTAFNQGCRGLVPLPVSDSRFLQQWLWSQRDELQSLGTGSTFLELSTDALLNTLVPARRVDEQRRIADFLDDQVTRIDKASALRRQQIGFVNERVQSTLSAAVLELWNRFTMAPVRRVVDGVEQGASPVADNRPADSTGEGVLKTSAIYRGTFNPDANKAVIDESSLDQSDRVHQGDVLVTRGSGSADLVGDVGFVADEPESRLYLSDLIYRLRRPAIRPEYLSLVLVSGVVRSQLRAIVRQGSGPAKIRGEDLLGLVIPIASDRDHLDLVRRARQNAAAADALTAQLERSTHLLAERKRSLITAAVTGEFDVSTASTRASDLVTG